MDETDKCLTAIVNAKREKSELLDDIEHYQDDVYVESHLPFNSIVISVNNKQSLEKLSDLESINTINIEGRGSVPTY